ncbi:MAG: NAD(P)-binding domain-containing protein [Gammaproteobacteria bacterium]|jgi:ornithine cyclodeaminase|nr:NAD(P)-binding domain-containing protein [Gammaproteobacteria bacterium]
MRYYDESDIAAVLDEDLALDAARQVFRSLGRGQAEAFASVRNAIGHQDAVFGNKSGFDRETMALGLKAGGYWRNNVAGGLPNHQSVTVLFDPDTGRPRAALSGNHLTAMRTAAACAVSIDALARRDSKTLAIVGAGQQAAYHLRAATTVREFERILIWNRTTNRAEALANEASRFAPEVRAADLEQAVAGADVVICVVSSFEPVVPADSVRPGTHIAAMGTDTAGKQELDPAIVAAASVFTDDVEQALVLGESQHAFRAGALERADIAPISEVLAGRRDGRRRVDEITLYDGTGLGLQDLVTAQLVLERMERRS